MKRYQPENTIIKEEKLQEVSMMVNTIQDAQETIAKCVTLIMRKKNMNVGVCMSLIGEGITSGIDSIDDLLPKAAEINPSSFQAKKRVIASRIARMLISYSKTK